MSWNSKKWHWCQEDFLGQSWFQGKWGEGHAMPVKCPWWERRLAWLSLAPQEEQPHTLQVSGPRNYFATTPPLAKFEPDTPRSSRTKGQVFWPRWEFSYKTMITRVKAPKALVTLASEGLSPGPCHVTCCVMSGKSLGIPESQPPVGRPVGRLTEWRPVRSERPGAWTHLVFLKCAVSVCSLSNLKPLRDCNIFSDFQVKCFRHQQKHMALKARSRGRGEGGGALWYYQKESWGRIRESCFFQVSSICKLISSHQKIWKTKPCFHKYSYASHIRETETERNEE